MPPKLDQLRPIALTDHFAKVHVFVAEQFIIKWLLSNINQFIVHNQFGSHAGANADKIGMTSPVITADFSKAFDRVDHIVVIRKLIELNPQSFVVKLTSNFLIGRISVSDTKVVCQRNNH